VAASTANAILGRFPILDAHNIDLTIPPKKRRGALHAKLRVRLPSGHLRTAHVYALHLGLSGIERKIQLRRFLASHPFATLDSRAPIVLGGDFNDVWGRSDESCSRPRGSAEQRRRRRLFPRMRRFGPSTRSTSAEACDSCTPTVPVWVWRAMRRITCRSWRRYSCTRGDKRLGARVRLVEPSGFSKVSALGVEEQRVNVVADFVCDPAERSALGDSYRVHARVVVWQKADAVRVPLSAIFRDGDAWAVFAIAGDRARKRVIEIGHRGDREAEALSGIAEGDRVVVHPGDRLTDGAQVKPLGR
jgi:hypothetical protein